MKYLASPFIYILIIIAVFIGFFGLGCVYLLIRDFELIDFIDGCMVSGDKK